MNMDSLEIKEELKEIQADINRLVYMWRRYAGIRDKIHDKIWLARDLDDLNIKIRDYFENIEKFDWDAGEVSGDEYGN